LVSSQHQGVDGRWAGGRVSPRLGLRRPQLLRPLGTALPASQPPSGSGSGTASGASILLGLFRRDSVRLLPRCFARSILRIDRELRRRCLALAPPTPAPHAWNHSPFDSPRGRADVAARAPPQSKAL